MHFPFSSSLVLCSQQCVCHLFVAQHSLNRMSCLCGGSRKRRPVPWSRARALSAIHHKNVTLASAANVAAKIASKLLSRHFPTLDTHVFQLPDPREGLRVAGYVSLSDKRACGSDAAFWSCFTGLILMQGTLLWWYAEQCILRLPAGLVSCALKEPQGVNVNLETLIKVCLIVKPCYNEVIFWCKNSIVISNIRYRHNCTLISDIF